MSEYNMNKFTFSLYSQVSKRCSIIPQRRPIIEQRSPLLTNYHKSCIQLRSFVDLFLTYLIFIIYQPFLFWLIHHRDFSALILCLQFHVAVLFEFEGIAGSFKWLFMWINFLSITSLKKCKTKKKNTRIHIHTSNNKIF